MYYTNNLYSRSYPYYRMNFSRSYYPRVVVYNFSDQQLAGGVVAPVPGSGRSRGKRAPGFMANIGPAISGTRLAAEAVRRKIQNPSRRMLGAAQRLAESRGYPEAMANVGDSMISGVGRVVNWVKSFGNRFKSKQSSGDSNLPVVVGDDTMYPPVQG